MDLRLTGKTALVTGSSKGIGRAIAEGLAKEGVNVVVHGRDPEQTRHVAQGIMAEGGRAGHVTGDLTRDDAVAALVENAENLVGTIDILVNNAGGSGGIKEDWSNARAETWHAAYDRNVLSALRVTTRLLPQMRQNKWGRVINISSLAATMTPPAAPDYAACKAALNAMTASMAKAVAADGVTVNAVSPGTIHSETLDARFRDTAAQLGLADRHAPWPEIERAVISQFAHVPVGRVGQLDEIAAMVTILASPIAAYITGCNLRVDGGLSPVL